jgi:hypothetical protein
LPINRRQRSAYSASRDSAQNPFGERLDLVDELPERLRDASVIHCDVRLTGRPDELRLVNATR